MTDGLMHDGRVLHRDRNTFAAPNATMLEQEVFSLDHDHGPALALAAF